MWLDEVASHSIGTYTRARSSGAHLQAIGDLRQSHSSLWCPARRRLFYKLGADFSTGNNPPKLMCGPRKSTDLLLPPKWSNYRSIWTFTSLCSEHERSRSSEMDGSCLRKAATAWQKSSSMGRNRARSSLVGLTAQAVIGKEGNRGLKNGKTLKKFWISLWK